MFVLFVELKARSACAERLESVLRHLVQRAASEEGVVLYTAQVIEDQPERFMLYECYRDRAAWKAHLALRDVNDAILAFDELLAEPPRITFGRQVMTTPWRCT